MTIVGMMMEHQAELGVRVEEHRNGATLIDCGVHARGSIQAGAHFVEVCLGGLATTAITMERVGEIHVPFLHLVVNHPAVACLGSQKAGWVLKVGDYSGMASGPARALAQKPKETYRKIAYQDTATVGVLALESEALPGEDVTGQIATTCGIEPDDLYVLVAPTRSIVGSVQVPGRIVTATLHRLEGGGYDTRRVLHATSRVPIAPVKKTVLEAMGTTNDCIIYGGSVCLIVGEEDPVFAHLHSRTSPDYGRPFARVLADAGHDLVKVESTLGFSPAEVTVNVLSTGTVHHFGSPDPAVLLESFGVREGTRQ